MLVTDANCARNSGAALIHLSNFSTDNPLGISGSGSGEGLGFMV